MSNNKYSLFCFANFFNDIPDFLYPIFKKDESYYFENGETDNIIENFMKADIELLIRNNIPLFMLNQCKKLQYPSSSEYFTEGSAGIYAFQFNNKQIVWGTKNSVLSEIRKHTELKDCDKLIKIIREVYDSTFSFECSSKKKTVPIYAIRIHQLTSKGFVLKVQPLHKSNDEALIYNHDKIQTLITQKKSKPDLCNKPDYRHVACIRGNLLNGSLPKKNVNKIAESVNMRIFLGRNVKFQKNNRRYGNRQKGLRKKK